MTVFKAKHSPAYDPATNHPTRYLLKWGDNLCPYKNLQWVLTHNFQNYWKQQDVLPKGEWMNKLLYPYHRTLFHSLKMCYKARKGWRNSECTLKSPCPVQNPVWYLSLDYKQLQSLYLVVLRKESCPPHISLNIV